MEKRFGQYEDFDPGMWESYYEPVDLYSTEWPSEARYIYPVQEEWPSETRYVDLYGQQVTADSPVVSGSSLLDVVRSILGIAAPVVTSALTAEQAQKAAEAKAAAATAATAAVQTSTTSPLTASMLSGITSNLPILAAVVIGGYLLLGRGKKSRRK